jgi:hypothetical protein
VERTSRHQKWPGGSRICRSHEAMRCPRGDLLHTHTPAAVTRAGVSGAEGRDLVETPFCVIDLGDEDKVGQARSKSSILAVDGVRRADRDREMA